MGVIGTLITIAFFMLIVMYVIPGIIGVLPGVSVGVVELISNSTKERESNSRYQDRQNATTAAQTPASVTLSSHTQETRRNSMKNDDCKAAVVAHSLGDTVPFSPSLPDVTSAEPSRTFRSDSYLAFFIKNAKSWGAKSDIKPIISYPYTFVICDSQTTRPIHFVTLETSTFGTTCLSIFDMRGVHRNLGRENLLDDEQAFIDRAIGLVGVEFGESLHELSPNREARRYGSAFS